MKNFYGLLSFFLIPLFLQGQACDNTRVAVPNTFFLEFACNGEFKIFSVQMFTNAEGLPSNVCSGDNKDSAIEVRFKDRDNPSFTPYTINFCMNTEGGDLFEYFSDDITIAYEEAQCIQRLPSTGVGRLVCGTMTFSTSEIGSCKSLYFKPPSGMDIADNSIGRTQFSFFPTGFTAYDCDLTGLCNNQFQQVNRPSFVGIPESTGNISQINENVLYVPAGATLIIDEDYTSTGEIILDVDAKIVVESGNTLTKNASDGGPRIKGCTNLWESIEVEDGGAVSFGGITVTDGHLGINLLGSATLSLDDVRFEDNVFSISSFGYPAGTIQTSLFSNNTFIGTGTIKPHSTLPTPTDRPVAGISLSHRGFKNFSAPSLAASNRFENISTGFISYSGTTITAQNTYLDCARAISLNGDGATGVVVASSNQITNCDEGIRLSRITSVAANNNISATKTGINVDVLGPLSMRIRDNTITGASVRGVRSLFNQAGAITNNNIRVDGNIFTTVGVDMLLSENLRVSSNIINTDEAMTGIHSHFFSRFNTLSENAITLEQASAGTNGIHLEGSTSNLVSCNNIESPGTTLTETFGILNENSDRNTFRCNTLTNVEVGINHVGQMNAVTHEHNTYDGGRVGLMIGKLETPNTRIGQQDHPGDTWEGTFTFYEGQIWPQDGTTVSQSRFNANASFTARNVHLDATEISGDPSWFRNDPKPTPSCGDGTIPSCSGTQPAFNDPSDALTFVDQILTADTILTDNEEWVLVNEIYYWIWTSIPPANWTPDIITFMDDYDDEPQGAFAEVQALLDEGTAGDSQIETLSTDNLVQLDDYVTNGNTSALATIQGNNAQLATLVAAQQSSSVAALSAAGALLQSITPTNSIETDYKLAYMETLAFLTNPSSPSVNVTALTPLADKCSTEYPRSVALSRGLLQLDAPIKYDTWDDCLPSTTPRSISRTSSTAAIYPNPTTGLLTVSDNAQNIVVRDLTGRIVLSESRSQGLLDISTLQTGVYLITYQVEGQQMTSKIIKQ